MNDCADTCSQCGQKYSAENNHLKEINEYKEMLRQILDAKTNYEKDHLAVEARKLLLKG